jgi:predicted ribosome quality control (RQC) complex YloA/Tae2 family protein
MIKNYFILNRFVVESANILNGKSISGIFTQEKNKIIIQFDEDGEFNFLEMNVNPGEPYINLRKRYSRSKKNTINLFPYLVNKIIDSIDIAEDDRIVRLSIQDHFLFFMIRGKYTNVISGRPGDKTEAFKKTDDEVLINLAEDVYSRKYLNNYNTPDTAITFTEDYFTTIKKKFPVLGNDILKETKRRITDGTKDGNKTITKVLEDLRDRKPAVFTDELKEEVHLAVETFDIFDYQHRETFNDIFSAQSFYLQKKYYLKEKGNKLKLIRRFIERELKKISNKINNLQGVLDRDSKEEEYQKIGNLLLINLKQLKPGMEEIALSDIYDKNNEIKIRLNKKFSPKKNADHYFDKAKTDKINYEKSEELIIDAKKYFERLKLIDNKIDNIEEIKELKSIMKELKIKDREDKRNKEDLRIKFKHYIIENKYSVYVGKDSKNNDLLTTRFAKQNDYWFHARSVSGSHVVLRVENTKEAVPKSVLKKTAAVAAYHSKAKTAGTVPVTYTFKKYVIKKKGFPVGTVHLLKEDVLLVKPEIPKGCEYISDE